MQKIPTFLERDWDGDRSRVIDQIVPGCEWVANGEGVATRKYDGTCCMIDDTGKFWKRYEVRPGKVIPLGFIDAGEPDEKTGKRIGWVPVGDGPEDRWHREAHDMLVMPGAPVTAGTYELVGPKIQGNPEGYTEHRLIEHAIAEVLPTAPRSFDEFAAYFEAHPFEGIVWHHPDGGMAKIKARDFGVKRAKVPVRA